MAVFEYKFSMVRNFDEKGLQQFLQLKISDLPELLKEQKGDNLREKICNLLNAKVKLGFDDSDIEGTLFQLLVYEVPERGYYIPLETNLSVANAIARLKDKYSSIIDRKLTEVLHSEEDLISIRQEQNKIIFLFKKGVAQLGLAKEKCNFYVPCIVDIDKEYMEIKFNQHFQRNAQLRPKGILEDIKKQVTRILSFATSSETFFLQQNQKYGEAGIHKGLYKMFMEESSRSMGLIKARVAKLEGEEDVNLAEKVLRDNISNYLKNDLKFVNPKPYVNKVMSTKYQDTAKEMKEVEFTSNGGFIFSFTFIDRKVTKSSNKSAKHKPVYYSRIYWDLKDTVKDYEEISELGIFWKFNKSDFTKQITKDDKKDSLSFVEVGFKEIHNILEIHYYVPSSRSTDFQYSLRERRLKEAYVIDKVKKII